MQVTYYGHSCFGVEIAGKHLLFDPFISPNELSKGKVDVNAVPADFILISHGHADHVADAVAIAKRTGAKVIAAYEIYVWLTAQGVENAHPMNTGGSWDFGTFKVKCTTAQHSSSLPDGAYGGNPMGFIIYSEEGNFYYSGDTALTLDMKLIPTWCKKLKAAFLPIGDNFTMDYQDAIIASDYIKCKKIVGVHFDTFGFIKIDHNKVNAAFDAAGKKLTLPEIGQKFKI